MNANILSHSACPDCQSKDALIARLRWDSALNMFRPAGLDEAIAALPTTTTYTVVLCDIDRLKTINNVTGNHFQTNRYLVAGLRVRDGEIAGQLFGDEFVFILPSVTRDTETDPAAFVARIARQLAGQTLSSSERRVLAAAQGVSVAQAKLSATFATMRGVSAAQVPSIIERLSCDVLAQKAQRDRRVKVAV